jgi:hypothetical protein
MSTIDSQFVNSVFNRIKVLYNLKNDADLARFLGVNPTTLAMHRKRGRLDFDKVISVCGDADLNWVFRGQSVSDDVVGYDSSRGEASDIKAELLAQLTEMRKVVERL